MKEAKAPIIQATNPSILTLGSKGNGVGASAGVEESDLAHRLGGMKEFGYQFLCLQATYYDFIRHQPFPVTQA